MKKIFRSRYALLYLATLILNVCAAAQRGAVAEPLATITFHVIDENGRIVDAHVDGFTAGDRQMASRFRGLHGTQIPYGVYNYAIKPSTAPSALIVHGRVAVWEPEYFLVVTLSREQMTAATTDAAASPGFVIRGRLESLPSSAVSEQPIWIRLRPIFQSLRQKDVSVDASGEFRIYEPLAGPYLLMVIRGENVLHVQQISFEENWQNASFAIRLADTPPAVMYVRPEQN